MKLEARFGNKLRQVRTNKKMSQGDIAKKLGVNAAYISQIERGLQNVSLKIVERLAKALGVSMRQLIP